LNHFILDLLLNVLFITRQVLLGKL